MDQATITAGYDRVAPFYRALSPLFLITPQARRKGIAALALRPGDTVLEVARAPVAAFPTWSTRWDRPGP